MDGLAEMTAIALAPSPLAMPTLLEERSRRSWMALDRVSYRGGERSGSSWSSI
jgi:hypothetical protein